MKDNTARKLMAQEIIKEATDTHGNLDLLRVFLITNSADIVREYEFMSKLAKDSYVSDTDKAIYKNALKVLINISLKRIELTDIMYNASNGETSVQTVEPETKIVSMIPNLTDILERVREIISKGIDAVESRDQAFELLKTTAGQGKILNEEGKPEIWDNNAINTFIDNEFICTTLAFKEDVKEKEEVKDDNRIGFETIFNHIHSLIAVGSDEPKIKESVKGIISKKIIKGKNAESDYLIKDDAVFEDYYTRILQNIINIGITAFKNKSAVVDKSAEAEKQIENEIKPFLKELDTDETQTSVAPVTKKIRDIYQNLGFKMSLTDALLKAKELAETIAPNLLLRNKKNKDTAVPTISSKSKTEDTSNVIYDESHNIQESNKPLWAEVEKYEYLDQLFNKGLELSKKGLWRDALSMSIILISSGKIKETETSTESLKWDIPQIKLWYHNVVEYTVTHPTEEETIDIKAEIINETEDNAQVAEQGTDKPQEIAESHDESNKEVKEVKQGPVAQIGTIDSEESIKSLKDKSLWAGTYSFKPFQIKTDHHRNPTISLEIVDATKEQEKDLLIIEENFTAFIDNMRNILAEDKNAYPKVKESILSRLTPFYELSGSEVKRIMGNLAKEANEIRKTGQPETPAVKEEVVTIIPKEEVKEIKEIPLESPAVEPEKSVESNEENQEQNNATVIPNTAGEPSINSNNTIEGNTKREELYKGFDDILKAKTKIELHKAVFEKVSEFSDIKEGIKAVYQVIDVAKSDHHFKKSQLHNYKNTSSIDVLTKINKIVEVGMEIKAKTE